MFASAVQAGNHTTFINCGAGPCPRCGGYGHIPNGIYNAIGNIIEIISVSQSTIDELIKIKDTLENLQHDAKPDSLFRQKLEQSLHNLQGLKKYIPKNSSELSAFLMIILTIINILINCHKEGKKEEINPTTVINQLNLINNNQKTTKKVKADEILGTPKVGRNDPCPCGSGKKYKKCCGK